MGASRRAEVESHLKRLLNEELGVDEALSASAVPTTPLLGHGIGLDSIEVMGLALGIEREFGIQIPDEDLTVELFRNLGTLIDYVLTKTQ